MDVRIEQLTAKILVGKKCSMTIANDQTALLFSGFMPLRKHILDTLNTDLYCVRVYNPAIPFYQFTPTTLYQKWAAVEVTTIENIPDGLETLPLEGGLYAVFLYKGSSTENEFVYRYIFEEWMPTSIYEVDNRPHFDVLGAKYSNNNPNSEEEIWVPIKHKIN